MKKYKIIDLLTAKISGEWGDDVINEKGVKVLRTTNFTNEGKINFNKVVFRKIDDSKIQAKKIKLGDIVIEKSGGSPNQPVGRVVFFDLNTNETFLTNNFTAILRPNTEIVYPKFLFYQLMRLYKKGITKKYQNQTTGIINLKLDYYLNEIIEIPEALVDQIRIATQLSRVETLIEQRKESISLLDELLRGAFLDMFSDPLRNEKGWEIEPLEKIAKSRLGKMLDKEKPKGTHVRKYLANFNIQWFKINFESMSEMPFLDRELIELELKYGDLLICEGGEVGRTAIWKNEMQDVYFQKALHRVRPNTNKVTSEYLAYFFWFTATITKFKK